MSEADVQMLMQKHLAENPEGPAADLMVLAVRQIVDLKRQKNGAINTVALIVHCAGGEVKITKQAMEEAPALAVERTDENDTITWRTKNAQE